jgi:hypothetical protein
MELVSLEWFLHGGAAPHVWNSVIGVWSLSQQF